MKILYVYFHSYNDMPYHVREWVEAALELGHKVTVITTIDPAFLRTIDWDNKVNVIQVEYPGNGIFNYFKLIKNYQKVIKTEIKSKTPDLIYERFSQISPATAKIAKKMNISYTVEINGIIENELKLSHASYLRQIFFTYIQKKVYKNCTSIITVTEQIKEWIVKKYKIKKNKIKTFSNGVNIQRFKPYSKNTSREKFNLPQDKFIVGFLGSLYPWSGLIHLIDAAQILVSKQNDFLFLIGGGQEPMKSELINMVKKKDLSEYFIFSGQVSWKDAPVYISTFDLAVLPADFSHLPSGISPQKLFSYLACKKTVIASAIPGLNEFFNKNKIGATFKSKNSSNLAAKISEYRNLQKTEQDKMKNLARICVKKEYSWSKIIDNSLKWIMMVSK